MSNLLLNKDYHPKESPYFIGARLIKIIKELINSDFVGISFEELLKTYRKENREVRAWQFILALDFLFLLGFVDSYFKDEKLFIKFLFKYEEC